MMMMMMIVRMKRMMVKRNHFFPWTNQFYSREPASKSHERSGWLGISSDVWVQLCFHARIEWSHLVSSNFGGFGWTWVWTWVWTCGAWRWWNTPGQKQFNGVYKHERLAPRPRVDIGLVVATCFTQWSIFHDLVFFPPKLRCFENWRCWFFYPPDIFFWGWVANFHPPAPAGRGRLRTTNGQVTGLHSSGGCGPNPPPVDAGFHHHPPVDPWGLKLKIWKKTRHLSGKVGTPFGNQRLKLACPHESMAINGKTCMVKAPKKYLAKPWFWWFCWLNSPFLLRNPTISMINTSSFHHFSFHFFFGLSENWVPPNSLLHTHFPNENCHMLGTTSKFSTPKWHIWSVIYGYIPMPFSVVNCESSSFHSQIHIFP